MKKEPINRPLLKSIEKKYGIDLSNVSDQHSASDSVEDKTPLDGLLEIVNRYSS